MAEIFFERINEIRIQFNNFQPKQQFLVYNVDQMPLYFDMPQNRTLSEKGERNIVVGTSGNEKLRFTLILCADNFGRKVMPAIIFKLANVPKVNVPGIHIMASPGGSANVELMKEWVDKVLSRNLVWNGSKNPNFKLKRFNLVLDAFSAHRSKEFRNHLSTKWDIHTEIVPAGMTPLLQPADTIWNKIVKSKVKSFWKSYTHSQSTSNEKLKKPSYSMVAQWCLDAWNHITAAQIKESFEYANLGEVKDDNCLSNPVFQRMKSNNRVEETLENDGFGEEQNLEEVLIDSLVGEEEV